MKIRKWLQLFYSTFILVPSMAILINYIVDPFQQYRVSSWYQVTEKKQRHVTPGLARNSTYDTLFVGSSMAENFDLSHINREMNTTSLNLSVAGMTAHELHHLLKVAIKANPELSNIVILLDVYALSGSVSRFRNTDFPIYLYDNDLLNDINYLLNGQTLKYSIKALRQTNNHVPSIDRLWNWQGDIEYSAEAVLTSMREKKFNKSFNISNFESEVLKKSFIYNVLPFIENHPDIGFTIVYPPYSYLAYKSMSDEGWLDDVFLFKRYMSKIDASNLRIFDFQCEPFITERLNNYKDITHYSPVINHYMIMALKEGKHLIGAENIDQCLDTIEQSSNNKYDMI